MLTDQLQKIYQKNQDYVARKIAGELVLIPLNRRLEDIKSIFNLNEMACTIWDQIDGQRSLEQIRSQLLEQFEVDALILDQDLERLISQLEEIKAIQLV